MQITSQQADALSRPVIDAFPARAAQFLKTEFPALAQRIEATAFEAFVVHGQRRAVQHGFASERAIVQYLLVMLYLGPRFDEDPKLVRLRPFLDADSPMGSQWRLNVLFDAARDQPEPGARRAA